MSDESLASRGRAEASHLDRLCRHFLGWGLAALAASIGLTWLQVQDWVNGPRSELVSSGLAMSLLVQALTVLASVLLTGAAFGYLLRALRRDKYPEHRPNEPEIDWFE